MTIVALSSFTDNLSLRQTIYSGTIFHITRIPYSFELANAARQTIENKLGLDYRKTQYSMSTSEFFAAVSQLKQVFYTNSLYLILMKRIIAKIGFDLNQIAVDPLRLRAVPHNGHLNKDSSAAYSLHRDTWYANSQSQINWWIPIHDVTKAETFSFYPALFAVPVVNTSNAFNYDDWKVVVGFGNSHTRPAALYPSTNTDLIESTLATSFSCQAGDIILFSAAHLHATNPNSSGLTRFSLDFRTVHLQDHTDGQGAPNVDNGSFGSALTDYLHPTAMFDGNSLRHDS